jgi:hypothetical protein
MILVIQDGRLVLCKIISRFSKGSSYLTLRNVAGRPVLGESQIRVMYIVCPQTIGVVRVCNVKEIVPTPAIYPDALTCTADPRWPSRL